MPISKTYNLVNSTGQPLDVTRITAQLTDGSLPSITFDSDDLPSVDSFELTPTSITLNSSYGGEATITGSMVFYYNLLNKSCNKTVNVSIDSRDPEFTLSTIGNFQSPGTPVIISVIKTSIIDSTWVMNNVLSDTNTFNQVPINNPSIIELHIFRQNEEPSDFLEINANNCFLNGEVNLTIFENLTSVDFSNNSISSVVIGDSINQDDNVVLDFSDNNIGLNEFKDLLYSFTPVNHLTQRIIDLRGQGYTIFDEPGVQDEILTRVLELSSGYNIEILGDFDFGNYSLDYDFDFD